MDKKYSIEVDCRLCLNCTEEGCRKYGNDVDVAVRKCADDSFKNYYKMKVVK